MTIWIRTGTEEETQTARQLSPKSIGDIKQAATDAITKQYPLYKQLNIMRDGPPEMLVEMTNFINGIRAKVDGYERIINSGGTVSTVEW